MDFASSRITACGLAVAITVNLVLSEAVVDAFSFLDVPQAVKPNANVAAAIIFVILFMSFLPFLFIYLSFVDSFYDCITEPLYNKYNDDNDDG